MFYCQKCATKYEWPDWSIRTSYGPCEMCRKTTDCFDVPSKYLPSPKHKETSKDDSVET